MAVEELWAFERRGLAGGGSGLPAGPEPDLAEAVRALREGLAALGAAPPPRVDPAKFAAALEKALGKLDAVPAGASVDVVEEELSKVEEAFLRAVRKGLTDEGAEELAARVEPLLAGTDDLPPAARDRLKRALSRRELRAILELPALSVLVG